MPDPFDPNDRLTTIERRLNRLRYLAWAGFLAAGGALAWGLYQRADPITEGQVWVAKDPSGRVRGMFGVSTDGVGLTMYDSTGQMRLDLGIAPGGVPGMILFSKGGEPVAALNLAEGSVPTLRLTNVPERVRVEVVPRAGQPAMIVREPPRPDSPPPPRTPSPRPDSTPPGR
jgi:hypothetical protein